MRTIGVIFSRELKHYFYSATAFIYLTLFLMLMMILTFHIGHFLKNNHANLSIFFSFIPYVFIVFMPALAMGLWAQEQKMGTIELLLTLPIRPIELVLGKFLASWAFACLAIMGTFPLWVTVSFLGSPDHYVITLSYLNSFLIAGCFLALSGYVSSCTNNQMIAFILSIALCFVFIFTGISFIFDPISQFIPDYIHHLFLHFSVLVHFNEALRGHLTLLSLFYYCSLITFGLSMTYSRLNRYRRGV